MAILKCHCKKNEFYEFYQKIFEAFEDQLPDDWVCIILNRSPKILDLYIIIPYLGVKIFSFLMENDTERLEDNNRNYKLINNSIEFIEKNIKCIEDRISFKMQHHIDTGLFSIDKYISKNNIFLFDDKKIQVFDKKENSSKNKLEEYILGCLRDSEVDEIENESIEKAEKVLINIYGNLKNQTDMVSNNFNKFNNNASKNNSAKSDKLKDSIELNQESKDLFESSVFEDENHPVNQDFSEYIDENEEAPFSDDNFEVIEDSGGHLYIVKTEAENLIPDRDFLMESNENRIKNEINFILLDSSIPSKEIVKEGDELTGISILKNIFDKKIDEKIQKMFDQEIDKKLIEYIRNCKNSSKFLFSNRELFEIKKNIFEIYDNTDEYDEARSSIESFSPDMENKFFETVEIYCKSSNELTGLIIDLCKRNLLDKLSSDLKITSRKMINFKLYDRVIISLDALIEAKRESCEDFDSLKEEIESTFSDLISDVIDSTVENIFKDPEIMKICEPDRLVRSITEEYNELIESKKDYLYKMLLEHLIFKSIVNESLTLLKKTLEEFIDLNDDLSEN